jgi:hypothetical protein
MPLICGQISEDIERSCDALPVGGVKPIIRVINIDDIATITYDATNPLIVTGITLKATKKAFKYEVYKRGHKPRFTLVASDFGPRYKHEVDSSIQVWDNPSKAQVEALNWASVVVIVENMQKTGDAQIEIYGLESGLEVADGAVRNLAANDGVYTYTLASGDDSLEPHIPRSFWSLTYAATQTALALLDVAAVA